MNLVDPEGKSTWVVRESDHTYKVVGGDITDNDLSIYEMRKNDINVYTREDIIGKVGITTSITSFYNSDLKDSNGKPASDFVRDAIIDLNDVSGIQFIEFMKGYDPDLCSYAWNARNGELYDFKVTNGTIDIRDDNKMTIYRGMPLDINSKGELIISSARDVGNMVAGYMAGKSGLSWPLTRFAFDSYQSWTSHKPDHEGESTTNAQRFGWESGHHKYSEDNNKKP